MFRLVLLLISNLAFSQSSNWLSSSLSFNLYKSGIVVSQNYLSSDIGRNLNKGGNVVDAAIALVFHLLLPTGAGNIGGGGFMQVFTEKDKTILTIDFRSMV